MFSDLKSLCSKYQYVSFDIFDTLIKRLTEKPNEVFTFVQNTYLERYGIETCIENYPELRIECERIARKRKQTEIVLEEIYEVISEYADRETVDLYKELEIELEMRVCVQYAPLKKIYDYCLSLGKNIYIISDMYLPKEVIEGILHKNGYLGYKRLFLSCVSRKTKVVGDLYEELLREEGINPNELLHIGDNLKSDVLIAKKKGIHTFWVKKRKKKYDYILDKESKGKSLYRFIECTNNHNNIFENVGYNCFGPLLYGFVMWVKKEVRTNNYNKLFFLSRDGFIMRKAYEVIRKQGDPESQYFYASRRALQVAAIHFNPEYEYVMSHMFVPRTVSVKWLIRRWGLEEKNVKDLISEYSLDEEFQGEGILYNARIRNLYNKLKKQIIINSKKEYSAFSIYLDQNGFFGKIAIVDIGWYGNMQNSIIEMISHMDRNIQLTGYYLGIVPGSKYQDLYNMHGFMFEKSKNEELYDQFKYMSSMLELFLMAPHGSAKRYVIKNGEVTAELTDFEFDGTDTYQNMIKLQNKALEFVHNYHVSKIEEFPETIYMAPLFERFTRPDAKTAEEFGNLQIWDDKWITLAEIYPTIKWILNPKEAVRRFIMSSWKMGYLKRNLSLPLPYDKIVYKSRKLYKK